ncbi:MAG: glycosyltransferase [Christensenellales bacterium]|jgi:1,2-diacylglycerol 3-alpha-glucosyltransferase
MDLVMGQFSDSYLPAADGVITVVRNYARQLDKRYGKCCVVAPSSPGFIDKETFEVIRYTSIEVPNRAPYRAGLPALAPDIQKRLNEYGFDIVHAHSPFSSGFEALRIARRNKIPIVATFHSKFYDDFKQAFGGSELLARAGTSFVVNFFSRVDQVWTVNRSTVDTLREYGFKKHIEIVSNGVNAADLDKKPEYRQRINEELGVSDDMPVLLYVGQHTWQKNLKMVIDAMILLRDSGARFKMVMVGSGYAAEDIKRLVKEADMEDIFHFTGTILDPALLNAYYARSNLFIFPSLYDTASIVVREAATWACPSVLVSGSNASEGITGGQNGLLCSNNAESLFSVIKSAISDPARLCSIGQNALETLPRYWDDIMQEVYLRYCDIIKSYKRGQQARLSPRKMRMLISSRSKQQNWL